jgi:CAAX prenyl protease-like protein
MNDQTENTTLSQADRRAGSFLHSDAFARILPFGLFMVFVAASSFLAPPVPVPAGEFDTRWLFAGRALVVGTVLLWLWARYTELRSGPPMRLGDWVLAVTGGVLVLVVWLLLDEGWVTFPLSPGFDPRVSGSEDLHLPHTVLRLLGLAVVVPVIEELFWRSFLMRWLEKQAFLRVDPRRVGTRALLITSVLFALEHSQWLAGFIAGIVYGWLYIRTARLWVPIVAHAVTHGLLGAYILHAQDWRFW